MTDERPNRTFRLSIDVYEVTSRPGDGTTEEERLVHMGAEVNAPSFVVALPALTKEVDDRWLKVAELAEIVDEGGV